jgi:hypothetical protein
MFAEPAVAASPQLPPEALPLDALQQQVDRLTATLGQPAQLPDEEALKVGLHGVALPCDALRGINLPNRLQTKYCLQPRHVCLRAQTVHRAGPS